MNGLSKTGCHRIHLQWDTPRRLDDEGTGWTGHEGNTQGVTVGQVLIGAATGSVASLFVPSSSGGRSGSHLWVPASDLATWSEYCHVDQSVYEDDVDDRLHFSGRNADLACEFGKQTWVPSPPLQRRGRAALSITVDQPTRRSASAATVTVPGQGVVLDWSDPSRSLPVGEPCRHCGAPAFLLDDYGVPCHKTCAEAALSP
ncbi:hypothetical protein J7E91_35065 [Streptomyces sp. ISL-99]|uniref:hypothetical protein n=1 Tax=Streptomyces sp. ISL-99 TaxID=2819193 RepID=UPI001BE8467D|nr:hypothetical protein [Streptomyces sp. ISL-99]MBT2530426.1 hypothetical protein [Streptomyces sp. ISL-99]